jgi:hypothetical protein
MFKLCYLGIHASQSQILSKSNVTDHGCYAEIFQDLGEHGIAPRRYATADTFTSEDRKRRRVEEAMTATRDSVLPVSQALSDLIVPEK